MTPFERGYITKMAGIFSSAKSALKYLPTAAALGVASGVGGELAFKAKDAITGGDPDNPYSFGREALIGSAIGIPIAYWMRKSLPQLLKSSREIVQAGGKVVKPNTSKYFKGLSVFGGADPLVSLKKGGIKSQLWKPAAGAATGAALNYDKDDKLRSMGKGALVGAAMSTPLMFKDNDAHQGVAHKFVNEIIDSPAVLGVIPAASAAYGKASSAARYLYDKATGQPKPADNQNKKTW